MKALILSIASFASLYAAAQPQTYAEVHREIQHRREAQRELDIIRDGNYKTTTKASNRTTISGDYNSYGWSLANSRYRKNQEAAQARQDARYYESNCIDGNCRSGRGEWRGSQGNRFIGYFSNGAPDLSKEATVVYGNKISVTGRFTPGRYVDWVPASKTRAKLANGSMAWASEKNGDVIFTNDNGVELTADGDEAAHYSGSTSNYCQGTCVETLVPGDNSYTYTGNTLNGLPHGKGVLKFNNGASYTGSFKEGRVDGFVKLSYGDGTDFEGWFKRGVKDGQGTMYYNDGSTITGYWKGETISGEGEEWTKWYMYKGTFNNELDFVKGVMAFKNGKQFNGLFKNGMPYYGDYFMKEDEVFTGYFHNNPDKVVPRVGVYFGKTSEYYGYFDANGKRSGYGYQVYLEDSSSFEGKFINDEPGGLGFYNMRKTGERVGGKMDYKDARIWGLATYKGDLYPGMFAKSGQIEYIKDASQKQACIDAYTEAANFVKEAKAQYQKDAAN